MIVFCFCLTELCYHIKLKLGCGHGVLQTWLRAQYGTTPSYILKCCLQASSNSPGHMYTQAILPVNVCTHMSL